MHLVSGKVGFHLLNVTLSAAGEGRGRKGQRISGCPIMLGSCLRARHQDNLNRGQNCSISLSGNRLIPLCSDWPGVINAFLSMPLLQAVPPEKHSQTSELFGRMLWVVILCGVVSAHLEGWLVPSLLITLLKVNGGGQPEAVSSSLLQQQFNRCRCFL